MIFFSWDLWAPETGTPMRRGDRFRMWCKLSADFIITRARDDEISHSRTALLRDLRIRGCQRASMLSGTCVSLMSFHCFHTIRGKSTWAECHLTALEKLFAVIVLFSANNLVIINFEEGERWIPENYLSLWKHCRKQYNQHTFVTVVGLTLKVGNWRKQEDNGQLRLRLGVDVAHYCFGLSYT